MESWSTCSPSLRREHPPPCHSHRPPHLWVRSHLCRGMCLWMWPLFVMHVILHWQPLVILLPPHPQLQSHCNHLHRGVDLWTWLLFAMGIVLRQGLIIQLPPHPLHIHHLSPLHEGVCHHISLWCLTCLLFGVCIVPLHHHPVTSMLSIQDALAAQPHAPSTTTGCSLTSVIGNIQKMKVMTVHMHKAELITGMFLFWPIPSSVPNEQQCCWICLSRASTQEASWP